MLQEPSDKNKQSLRSHKFLDKDIISGFRPFKIIFYVVINFDGIFPGFLIWSASDGVM